MTAIGTTTIAVETTTVDPGCGCCKPAPAPSAADQLEELEARRAELQRRLAMLSGEGSR